MRRLAALSCLLLVAAAPPTPDAKLRAIVAPVSAERMKATVEKLVSFGTRHTLSSQTDLKRGIGAALEWARREFQRNSAACGDCLTDRRSVRDVHRPAHAARRRGSGTWSLSSAGPSGPTTWSSSRGISTAASLT